MRKPNEVVQLKLRFAERLRARLEKAASKTDNSLNTEIIRRLERSFAEEDVIAEALGGHELRHLALSFASSFADGCKSTARASGHDEWIARDWIQDQDCYRIGIVRADEPDRSHAKSFAPGKGTTAGLSKDPNDKFAHPIGTPEGRLP